ncbi:MAG: valine--tRNA ligase [Candidatus Gracilibacteria bacterium]
MDKKEQPLSQIPKAYDPKNVEQRLYTWWKKEGLFAPKPGKTNEKFSIVLPPPNVTGNLHIGHATRLATQDALVRYHRMKGDETVWIPGTDHAGISTQVVVEKKLAEQGKTRHQFSRDEFVKKVWDWVKIYKKNITEQEESMGASCDWSKERFTFDDDFNKSVNKVFVDLHKKDLIYQGDYIVNWCSRCATVLSDLEVISTVEKSKLYFIRYFLKAADKSVIVATTRPETMLGDVAIAVHPSDKRYKEFMDKMLILPILNKEIPVITDERVDMEFGTGAVKITPAHDLLDFEIGRDHNLGIVPVITTDGKMNKSAGKFAGLDVIQARQNIIEYLDNIGNLESIEDYDSSIKRCERCNTIVEPLISKQWFVRTKPMAEKALAAVKKGKTDFIPDRFEKEFVNWMENIKDWCISRQLWWGHQIPVYYGSNGEMQVSETAPENTDKVTWKRDEDVLDTWFSSSLWPFVVFGWPEKTEDFKKFYPTSVLETGRDILFFWVCRMMMMGTELTGQSPFSHVFLGGLVRDQHNQKMSKSKGNGVEPKIMQEQYGTDALRLMLTIGTTPGNDFPISESKAENYRNFVNKLWNASRFIRMNMSETKDYATIQKELEKNYKKLSLAERWILSRLSSHITDVSNAFENFMFGESLMKLYEFSWHEFCDWYIEISKIDKNEYTDMILQYGIMTILKLWHPVAPFVTEEIWSNFGQKDPLIISEWPEAIPEFKALDIEADFEILINIVKGIRNIRQEKGVLPGKLITAHFVADKKEEILQEFSEIICKLARLQELKIHKGRPILSKKVTLIIVPFEIYLPLEEMLDIGKERARLKLCVADSEKALRILNEKLSNQAFVDNAPEEIVEAQQEKKRSQEEVLATLRIQLAELEE